MVNCVKESVIVSPPPPLSSPAISPEVLITADLCDTINEKLIQIEGKKWSSAIVVINLAISAALNRI